MPTWTPWDARADADFIVATTTYRSGLPNSIPLSALSVPISLNDNVQLGFGAPDAVFEWNTDQTNHALMTGLSGSNNWIITTKTRVDAGYDHTFANSATPTLYITDGTASTTKWIRFYHDGTNGYIDTGTGAVYLQDEVYSTTHMHFGTSDTLWFGDADLFGILHDGTTLQAKFGTVIGLKLDDSTIAAYAAASGVAGKSVYVAMQGGLDLNAAGGSLYWSGGTAHGSGTGGSLFLTPGGTTSGTRGNVTVYQNAIATTSTDGIVLENTTSTATGDTVQYSPRMRFRGHAKNSTSGLDETHDWTAQVVPATVAGATTSQLQFLRSLNGAAYAAQLTISSAGTLVSTGAIYSGGSGTLSVYCGTVTSGTASTLTVQNNAFSAADSAIEAATGAWTNSTGAAIAFELKPVWNQTGNASAIGLLVNPTETAIGSGGYVPIEARRNGIATTSSDGLLLSNNTAAVVGPGATVQMSPRISWLGYAWKSDATAASESHRFFAECLPATGTASTTATWKLGYSYKGAAATYPFTITDAGAGYFASTLNANGNLLLTGSVDSVAVEDQVSLGRYEIGAGNTVLAISQETAVAVDVDETKFSHKLQVRVNGATYFLMMTAT